jgi:Fe-S cluster biosynthesis and repair protein YggX
VTTEKSLKGEGVKQIIWCGVAYRLVDSPPRQSNTIAMGAPAMAHNVFCVRYKKEMEGLDEPPFDSEFGQKVYKNVSKAAWSEWVDRQKMLLNEYRLQPWTPQAQQFLVEQMEMFFFGEGSALPSDYVPPAQ